MTLDEMRRSIADECGCSTQDTHQAAQVALDASYQASDFELMSASRMSTTPGKKHRIAATLRIKPAAFALTRQERKAR